mgnify:CR=1 FL=1
MAITKVELPITWSAYINRMDTYEPKTSWYVSDIKRDSPDYQIISYITPASPTTLYGTMLGMDYSKAQRLLQEYRSSIVKVKLEKVDGSLEEESLITVHNIENPVLNSYVTIHQNISQYIKVSPELGTKEINLSNDIIDQLLLNGVGIAFVPEFVGYDMINVKILRLVFEGEWTPNIPTLKSPIGGVKMDITKNIIFEWIHDGVFSQSGYELRYRPKGTTQWLTVNGGADQSYTLPANTLTSGEYEWQVRTKMEHGGQEAVSEWSTIGVFMATEATNAPIIVTPQPGEVIPVQDLTIEWEPVTNQIQFEVELLQGGQRVQHELRTSSNNKVTFPGWLENNQSYVLRVRVLAENQFWSDWAEVNISVSYTAPAKPVITITPNSEDAYLEIDVYNPPPTGTEPTAVSQELFRREPGGPWVKIANLSPNGKFNDYTVASGKVYEYRAVVLADNDVTNTSDNFPGYVKFNFDVIAVANNPVVFVKLKEDPRRSFSKNFNAIRKQFAGRKQIVTEFGETIGLDSSLGYFVQADDLYKLDEIASRQETLLYRDVRGRKHYITIEQMNVNDEIRLIDHYSVEMTITEVYYKEGVN